MKRTIVTTEEIDADSGECGRCTHQGVMLGVSVCQRFGGKKLRLSPVLERHMRIDDCLDAELVARGTEHAIKMVRETIKTTRRITANGSWDDS